MNLPKQENQNTVSHTRAKDNRYELKNIDNIPFVYKSIGKLSSKAQRTLKIKGANIKKENANQFN